MSRTSSRSRPTPISADHDHAATSRSMRRPLRASQTAKPEPVAARDHLRRDHDQPREPGGHAQRGDHLRRDRGQRHLAQQLGALDAEVARDAEVDARDARHRRAGREHDREERRHEDQEDRRRVADAEPEDRERDPGERRQAAEEVHQRQERLPRPAPSGRAARPAGTPRTTASRKPARRRGRATRSRRRPAGRSRARRRGRARPRAGAGRATPGTGRPTRRRPTPRRARRGRRTRARDGAARKQTRFPVNSMRRRDASACAL